jgi:hypothetical protein
MGGSGRIHRRGISVPFCWEDSCAFVLLVGLVGGRLVVDPALAFQDALVGWGHGGQCLAGAEDRGQRGRRSPDGEGPDNGATCAPAAGVLLVLVLPPVSCFRQRAARRRSGTIPAAGRVPGGPGEGLLSIR